MSADLLALGAAIAGLFAGPMVLWWGGASRTWRAALDGLVIAVVSGLCLLHLGPHALEHGGWWAALGFGIGAALPIALHRLEQESLIAFGGVALLCAHAAVDGAALSVASTSLAPALAAAIVVHRLPVGLVIAGYASTRGRAVQALGALAAFTVVGFALGGGAVHLLGEPVEALLEGLVVGGLLHVVTAHRMPRRNADGVAVAPEAESTGCSSCGHDHGAEPVVIQLQAPLEVSAPPHDHEGHSHGLHDHLHHHAPHDAQQRRWSAGGALAGLGLVLGFFALAAGDHSLHHVEATGRALLSLTLTSAPALLLGFVLAGLASGLLASRQSWLQGGPRSLQALKGVSFGLPLPICSCGVVPVYRSLVRGGVPLTAALAFLVATPELGLDAILLSVPLLGVPLTIARIVAAFGVAVVVAWIVGMGMPETEAADAPAETELEPLADRLREGLRYGLVDLVDDTLPWIATGLVIAALAEPLLGHELLLGLPSAVQVPLAAVLGIPLYVCASGATPLAAMAVHKGLSAGAALTFLLAGPATNATTFGVLSALHGRALALRFGVVLTAVAVLAGWGVDALGVTLPAMAHPDDLHAHGPDPVGWVSMLVLIGLGVASLGRLGARGVVDQVLQPVHEH